MGKWFECLTPQTAFVVVVWLVFCIVVIAGAARRTAPVRKRFRALLVDKFGMRPCCPHCEEFIPEPRPNACLKCGTRLPPRRD